MEAAPDNPNIPVQPDKPPTRRDLLMGVGAIVAGCATMNAVVESMVDSPASEEPEAPEEPEEKDHGIDPYVDTIVEQFALMIAQRVIDALGQQGGSVVTPEAMIEKLTKTPLNTLAMVGFILPLGEEVIFRLGPSGRIPKSDKGMRWDIGAVTTVAFSALHLIGFGKDGELKMGRKIPITQFISGLYRWWLTRNPDRGGSHAILSHCMNNGVPLGLASLAYRFLPRALADRLYKPLLGS
jgi:hypothetical protein